MPAEEPIRWGVFQALKRVGDGCRPVLRFAEHRDIIRFIHKRFGPFSGKTLRVVERRVNIASPDIARQFI